MIIRVFRAEVTSGRDDIVRFVRDEAIPRKLGVPGLLSFHPAITPAGELVLVSTWTDFDALLATQRDLNTAIAMPPTQGLLGPGHADHFELVFGDGRYLPLTPSVIRLTRGPLIPGREAAYFDEARRLAEELMDDAGLAAYHLGRRAAGLYTEAIAVSVWARDQAPESPASGRIAADIRPASLAAHYAAAPVSEELEALTLEPAAADAPAILVADDQRRYIHATPRAARLTGYSLARLLTKRVDDLAAPELRDAVPAMWDAFVATGTMNGPFALTRADGSSLAVKFNARVDAPWPGSYASVLTEGEDEAVDIDEALVQAGILTRVLVTA